MVTTPVVPVAHHKRRWGGEDCICVSVRRAPSTSDAGSLYLYLFNHSLPRPRNLAPCPQRAESEANLQDSPFILSLPPSVMRVPSLLALRGVGGAFPQPLVREEGLRMTWLGVSPLCLFIVSMNSSMTWLAYSSTGRQVSTCQELVRDTRTRAYEKPNCFVLDWSESS